MHQDHVSQHISWGEAPNRMCQAVSAHFSLLLNQLPIDRVPLVDTHIDCWDKQFARSLNSKAENIREHLEIMVRHWGNAPLPRPMAGKIVALLQRLSEIDIFVLKYQIMSLGKRVGHAGKHTLYLATLETNLIQASANLKEECRHRQNRKIREDHKIRDSSNVLRLELTVLAAKEYHHPSDDPQDFFKKCCKVMHLDFGKKEDQFAKDTDKSPYIPWTPKGEEDSPLTPLVHLCKQTLRILKYNDKGKFCGCIHGIADCQLPQPYDELNKKIELILKQTHDDDDDDATGGRSQGHTCGACEQALKTQTKSRARWQKGFRGFELVSVVASAVMMLSWVWPRPYGAHKMQPWATRHDKELWLSISAGLATFFALLSFGKQIMSPIGVHANLGQTKWLNAVAWAVGDLLTAISGIVTIMLIFQHQLFEQDLGEPDSTRFLFLSCMYGLDVVYQLVFLTVLCMGCSACTGHSNGKKHDKSGTPQDKAPLLKQSHPSCTGGPPAPPRTSTIPKASSSATIADATTPLDHSMALGNHGPIAQELVEGERAVAAVQTGSDCDSTGNSRDNSTAGGAANLQRRSSGRDSPASTAWNPFS